MNQKQTENMLKYAECELVFREFPNETTLAFNITNCPNRCVGCHSPHLQKDIGVHLTLEEISLELEMHGYRSGLVTCVGLMGGDGSLDDLYSLAEDIKKEFPDLKVGWYSGNDTPPEERDRRTETFDYVKTGHYDPSRGPLTDPNTNQKLFKREYAYPVNCEWRETVWREIDMSSQRL